MGVQGAFEIRLKPSGRGRGERAYAPHALGPEDMNGCTERLPRRGYAALTLFPEDTSVLTVEYKVNLLSPALGDHIRAVGTVLKSGRTLTVCRLEVFGVNDEQRKLVATGQQTLICVS